MVVVLTDSTSTTRTEAGKFTLGTDSKGEAEAEEPEVDARAELQSFLELQCVTRASRCVCVRFRL